MIQLEVIPNLKVINNFRVKVERFPQLIQPLFRKSIQRESREALETLRTLPGSPHYPIRWKSERQRRAFFATDGFGRGIPTQRSGTVAAGWHVDYDQTNRESSEIILVNDVPYARYVYGPDQQPFHAETGWPELTQVSEDMTISLGDVLVDNFFQYWQEP